MTTVFSRIISGELPGELVWEDEACVAFLSVNPLSDGHTLVVPRTEIDDWLTCPDELRDRLFEVAQVMGRAIKTVYSPPRVAVVIAGFEVPHLHVHVFGAEGLHSFDFARARTATQESLASVAGRLRAALPR